MRTLAARLKGRTRPIKHSTPYQTHLSLAKGEAPLSLLCSLPGYLGAKSHGDSESLLFPWLLDFGARLVW
jgi:hypothetical protein